MGAPQEKPLFSIEDYLAWEAQQPERHEYLQGEVFAMTGARDAHNTIALNIATSLRSGPCRVYISDMKLRVDAVDAVSDTDLMVTCDRRPDADMHKRHPKLIVAVLAESTAADDRGRKFEVYRTIDTRREVLRVARDRRHLDLFRRAADGRWVLESHGPADEGLLASVGVTLAPDSRFEAVKFAAS